MMKIRQTLMILTKNNKIQIKNHKDQNNYQYLNYQIPKKPKVKAKNINKLISKNKVVFNYNLTNNNKLNKNLNKIPKDQINLSLHRNILKGLKKSHLLKIKKYNRHKGIIKNKGKCHLVLCSNKIINKEEGNPLCELINFNLDLKVKIKRRKKRKRENKGHNQLRIIIT